MWNKLPVGVRKGLKIAGLFLLTLSMPILWGVVSVLFADLLFWVGVGYDPDWILLFYFGGMICAMSTVIFFSVGVERSFRRWFYLTVASCDVAVLGLVFGKGYAEWQKPFTEPSIEYVYLGSVLLLMYCLDWLIRRWYR